MDDVQKTIDVLQHRLRYIGDPVQGTSSYEFKEVLVNAIAILTNYQELMANSCLASRLPGEPMFVLLARDDCAPDTVDYWAHRREYARPGQDTLKLFAARQISNLMKAWRIDNYSIWRKPEPLPGPDALTDHQKADLLAYLIARLHLGAEHGARAYTAWMKSDLLTGEERQIVREFLDTIIIIKS